MPYDESLRKLWKAAGYGGSMGSSCVVRPPPPEFIRLYHLTSAEHALSNVEHRRLKVALFSDLNDPFELFAVIGVNRWAAADEAKRELGAKEGLLCFSEDWTDPVYWSHYGDRHRGVSLGFDVRRTVATPVKYEAKRLLKKTTLNDKLGLDGSEDLRSVKFASWKYEREHRVVVTLSNAQHIGPLYFWPFETDLELREVIIGHDSSLDVDSVRVTVDRIYSDVTTFKARLAFNHFAVVPKEKSVP